MIQNDKFLSIEKPKDPENVIAMLYPNLPYIIRVFQFFEIFTWNNIDTLNEIKHKGNLLKLFIGERIKIFFHRASTSIALIEFDFSHG